MSKKKNKFKKSKKRQLETISVSNHTSKNMNETGDLLPDDHESISQPIIDEKPDVYKTDKYDHVKTDIKKILIIMSIILLALIVIYFIGLKTSFLGTFGDWIYKILNISTG